MVLARSRRRIMGPPKPVVILAYDSATGEYVEAQIQNSRILAVVDDSATLADLATIDGYTQKIDDLATNGLAGVRNSLAYRVHEIERHFHVRDRWYGKLAVQTATDWADDSLIPYQAISGNGDYGADANDEALVLGTDDTPDVVATNVWYDLRRLLIVDVSEDTEYKLRIVYGPGTMAGSIGAGAYTEVMVKFDSTNPQQSAGIPFELNMPRAVCGIDQVWIQAKNATDNATIDFYVACHEYEG